MGKLITRGVNLAVLAALVGSIVFVVLDQLIKWLTFGLSLSSLWLEVLTLLLLCGTAVAVTLPFSVIAGSLLGAAASRIGRARLLLAIGIALGVMAMLGGFSVVYYGAVCLTSHGLCYQDPIGWMDWSIQRDFLGGGFFYPRRLALSTVIGAIGGGWVARRLAVLGPKSVARQSSA